MAPRVALAVVLIGALAAAGCVRRSESAGDDANVRASAERPSTVTVVSLADFHGALEPQALTTAGGDTLEIGGAALISAYIQRIRETASGPVVVVDSGDMWQGTLVSNLQEGAPVVRFYNHLGVAAAALGNHEFDFGPAGADKTVPVSPDDDPRGALKERVAEARFPLLGINVRKKADDRMPSWVESSVVVEEQGVRIGIVGGATRHTGSTTLVANVADLEFLPLAGPVEAEARRLREEGVDVIVATVHAGGGCEDNTDPDDLSSCREGELFHLIGELPEGLVDVFAGGHSHQAIAKHKKGAAVMQPFSRGMNLTWAEVPLSGDGSARVHGPVGVCGGVVEGPDGPTCRPALVRRSTGPVRPAVFLGATIEPDEAALEELRDDFAVARRLRERPLGIVAAGPIRRSYGSESALGNLVADMLLAAVDGADAAFINGGGLRASLPAGDLKYGDLFEALPFDNRLAVMEIDGGTLRRIVEHGHRSGHSALAWSGLRLTARGCGIASIEVGGLPLDDDARYRVVTNSYLAGGGSGLRRLGLDDDSITTLWNMPVVRDVVAKELSSLDQPLRPERFFSPRAPRQRTEGDCP